MVFKRNGSDWLQVDHTHLHAYLRNIITDAFINRFSFHQLNIALIILIIDHRSESGYLKPFAEEKGIPTKNSSPMKDPGKDFVFEANGDLLFQGYLVLETTHLPRIALELAKYLYIFPLFPLFFMFFLMYVFLCDIN